MTPTNKVMGEQPQERIFKAQDSAIPLKNSKGKN